MHLGKIFARGLFAVTPIAVTIAVLIWVFMFFENTFAPPLRAVIGDYYFPGLGIVIAFILIFLIGTVINNMLIQKFYHYNDKLLRRIPLIKTIYNSISDVMGFFSSTEKERLGHVVMLKFNGWRVLGFVTREDMNNLPEGLGRDDEVAVYVPFSYQLGGYTFMVPRSELEEVAISAEEAMRFTLTAGMLKGTHKESHNHEEE